MGWCGALRCIFPSTAYESNTVHPRLVAKSKANICTGTHTTHQDRLRVSENVHLEPSYGGQRRGARKIECKSNSIFSLHSAHLYISLSNSWKILVNSPTCFQMRIGLVWKLIRKGAGQICQLKTIYPLLFPLQAFFVVVRINIFQASLSDSYYILSFQP